MSLAVKIVTPQQIVFEGSADSVTVPGWLGEYGVLEHHASMLTLSKPGMLSLKTGNAATKFVVDRGFVEVGPKDISVMVQQCIQADQVDKEEAKTQLAQAQEALQALKTSDPTYEATRKKVEFAKVLTKA